MAGVSEPVERLGRDSVSRSVEEAEIAAGGSDLVRDRAARVFAPGQQGRHIDDWQLLAHKRRLAYRRNGLKRSVSNVR